MQKEPKKPSSYPEDEIPGWTSYIYTENRDRRADEYVNAWKWFRSKSGIDKNFPRDLLEKTEWYDRGDYLSAMVDYEQEISNEEQKYKELQQTLKNITDARDTALLQADKFKHEYNKTEQHYQILIQKASEQIASLQKYGSHSRDCKYIKMLRKGRTIRLEESKACTCGWLEVKDRMTEPNVKG